MSEQQRWRVEKRDRWIAGEFWAAFQGEKGWFDNTSRFDAWAEAMTYADRMAHTATITLPVAHPQHARKETN